MEEKTAISLRMAQEHDESFIRELSSEAFSAFGDYGDVVLKWFKSGGSDTIIACCQEKTVGFAMISEPFSRYDIKGSSELLAIAVEEQWQGKRVGSVLLKELENMAQNKGISTVFLHTAIDNIRARRLFFHAGFRTWQVKKKFYPEGQDAIMMAKEIA